jgi:hypothetical protein
MAEKKSTAQKLLDLVKVLEVIFLLLNKLAMIVDKLRNGVIDPDNVDLQKLIDDLEALDDLPEN